MIACEDEYYLSQCKLITIVTLIIVILLGYAKKYPNLTKFAKIYQHLAAVSTAINFFLKLALFTKPSEPTYYLLMRS